MNRRKFLAALGGAAVAPVVAPLVPTAVVDFCALVEEDIRRSMIAAIDAEIARVWNRTHILCGNIWFHRGPIYLRPDQIVELPE